MTSLYSRIFYFLLSSSVISLVTTPSICDQSTLTQVVLKIENENEKEKEKENKKKRENKNEVHCQ